MLTPDQISTTLLNAKYALAVYVNNDIVLMNGACQPKSWAVNMAYNAVIKGLEYQNNRQDYTSDLTYSLYKKVVGIAGYTGNIPSIDPNYQAPNTTIIVDITGPSFQYMNKTQADLVYDAPNDSYYLPFLNNSGAGFPIGSVPITIILNDVQMESALNTGFVPQRIYGFANNIAPQIITVTVAVP